MLILSYYKKDYGEGGGGEQLAEVVVSSGIVCVGVWMDYDIDHYLIRP